MEYSLDVNALKIAVLEEVARRRILPHNDVDHMSVFDGVRIAQIGKDALHRAVGRVIAGERASIANGRRPIASPALINSLYYPSA